MQEKNPSKKSHDLKVILFVIVLCFVTAFLLAIVSYSLQKPQAEAKEFDQSKQMLIAAQVLSPNGSFLLAHNGKFENAQYDPDKKLLVRVPEGTKAPIATNEAIKRVAASRIRALVTDSDGKVYTLPEQAVELETYLSTYKKTGYASAPLKLFYVILPNEMSKKEADEKDLSQIEAIVIPVSGFGLWAPIYGYIALKNDADTVLGTTWYEHGETPGLGANIAMSWWQEQFYGKVIFQQSLGGKTDFKTAPMGIVVVKGKAQDVYGGSPKLKSAVDGISGATITGDGVTQAYRNSLVPYRKLLLSLHEINRKKENHATSDSQ